MAKMLIATVALMVTRDPMTILPVTVPAHEVEVQKIVFGEDNVEVLDSKPEPIELDPSTEGERLVAKYGSGAVEGVFGANFKGAVARAAAEHAVKAPKTAAKPAGEGDEGGEDLQAMNKTALLALATEKGVQADASMNKTAIIAAIEAAAQA